MRRNELVGKRYATAFFQVAAQHSDADDMGRPDEILAELELVTKIFESNEEARKFFQNPVISKNEKRMILQELQNLRPAVVRFLQLLVEAGRIESLNSITSHFRRLLEEASGELSVDLKTAHPLPESSLDEIRGVLESVWGQRVKMAVSTSADLLGGFVARSRSKTLDASVRFQLENLRQELEAR